jgi:hypothetical protein
MSPNGRTDVRPFVFPASRRFPPPWFVEEGERYFVMRDHDGHALTYLYFEDEPGLGGRAR